LAVIQQTKTHSGSPGIHNLEVLSSSQTAQSKSGKQYLNQLLQITGALQTTLEVEKIIETFADEIRELLPHNSISYEYPAQDIQVRIGEIARNSCSYQLVVCGQSLGQISLTRNRKFTSRETSLLEKLLCCLVYPLRNAMLYRHAQQAALKDPLTGVNNRVSMDDVLSRELHLARRHSTPLTLIALDIDKFKQINDTYGHLTGDYILKSIADTIADCIRGTDILFRYGGEEFTIVLSNTGRNGALLLAERIRKAIENRIFTSNSHAIALTVSIGVASADATDDKESLFHKADIALYQAKSAGRNCVVVHEEAPAA
jgi:diguanylate cyclase (GGDEF)-like protein